MVENKTALAYFAAFNRNQSLYNALRAYYNISDEDDGPPHEKKVDEEIDPLDLKFLKMLEMYDFLSVVMYPDLQKRRNFVHECFNIALERQNEELKMALSRDPYFFMKRKDILLLLEANDIKMMKHVLSSKCHLHITSDASYKLVAIKNE